MTINAPPQQVNTPLIHKVCDIYKKFYTLSSKSPKRDKLGIYLRIENICLDVFHNVVTAAFSSKDLKLQVLNSARIKIEVLKRLIRIANELNIVQKNKYIELETDLQEISKMTNGWIKYLTATL